MTVLCGRPRAAPRIRARLYGFMRYGRYDPDKGLG
ncbi:hypothetical protein SCANM63S_03199 [Streptomyces canarius]